MWVVAFTLGLFGSLHCVGMCGPLAIAFCSNQEDTMVAKLKSGIGYNLGRTFTYSMLGLGFGLLGTLIVVANLQKVISIMLGLMLVMSYFLSYDIDQRINRLPMVKRFYDMLRQAISKMYNRAKQYHPFTLGVANGLLPCGLVYLALAGAIAAGTLLKGMLFMALFGLGTFPMMLTLILGYNLLSSKTRLQFRQILPYVTLFFGLFLIYRGIVVGMPAELNFWEMIKNPVMCH